MPTKKALRTAFAYGVATVLGGTGLLVLLFGVMTQLALDHADWSPQMAAETASGIALMLGSGVVMCVLAVISGLLGWRLGRGGEQRAR